MPRNNWHVRIKDMLDAAQKIMTHTQSLDYEQFIKDTWTVDAVLYNLTIIGEAARHLPEKLTSRYLDVPWPDIRDMRNIIIHEYFGVDLSIIWKTIREDIPQLVIQLETILKDEPD